MYGYDEMGLLARQVRDLRLDVKLYSFATVTSPGFLQAAQGSAEGIVIVHWSGEGGERLQKFLAQFKAKEGREPYLHISTLPTYDVAKLIARCIDKGKSSSGAKSNFTSELLLPCLYKTKDYLGVSGLITMDADGVTRSFHHGLTELRGTELKPLKN